MKKVTLFVFAITATFSVKTMIAQGNPNSPNRSDHHVPPGKPPKPPKPPKNNGNAKAPPPKGISGNTIYSTPKTTSFPAPKAPVSGVTVNWPSEPAVPKGAVKAKG